MPPTCKSSGPLRPWSHLFSPTFLCKETQPFLPWRGGKLRHSKASCLAQGQGRGQEEPLIWAGLFYTGYFLTCMMSIRSLLLLLVNKLFRNYSDALCHQILITRSAFLVVLHGAVQAASQAPEGQASSKYTCRLFLITAGRHQLGPDLFSTSYCQRGISTAISTSWRSFQEGHIKPQAPVPPPVLGDNPGKSHIGRHTGGPPRSMREGPLRWPALGSTRHQQAEAAGRRSCLC